MQIGGLVAGLLGVTVIVIQPAKEEDGAEGEADEDKKEEAKPSDP
jgi:hypothetical protein